MKESETNCPNCGAPFESPISANCRECSYCGVVYDIDVNTSTSQTRICDTELPAQKLLKISNNKTFTERPMKTFEMMCICLNENYTFERYDELFKKMAYSNEHIATPIVHKDLLNKICSKASVSNEMAVFWNSNAVISKTKSGILLTDKNIYFVTKRGCRKMSFKDINAINALTLGNVWYFNNDTALSVDSIGCTDEQLGIVLAFVCTKARAFNLKGYRISID